jgi:dTDP-glucose 4,6-dehydratase
LQVRDWLYVEDHCRGIELVIDRGKVGETYNIGGGAELPNMVVIDTICAAVDSAFARDPGLRSRFPDAPAASGKPTATLKSHVTDRPGHDRRYAIDKTKATRELGYEPAHGFESRFAQTLDWYLQNEAWWRSITSGEYRLVLVSLIDSRG